MNYSSSFSSSRSARPAAKVVFQNTTSSSSIVSSSSHARCCVGFPVALTRWVFFLHKDVYKVHRKRWRLRRFARTGRSVFPSATNLDHRRLRWWCFFAPLPSSSSSPPSLSLPRLFPRFPPLSGRFCDRFEHVLSASRRPPAPETSGTFSSLRVDEAFVRDIRRRLTNKILTPRARVVVVVGGVIKQAKRPPPPPPPPFFGLPSFSWDAAFGVRRSAFLKRMIPKRVAKKE